MMRCTACGGRRDRPGIHGCRAAIHPAPTMAQRLALAAEFELSHRPGVSWDDLDADAADELRDAMAIALGDVVFECLARLLVQFPPTPRLDLERPPCPR